VCILYVFVCVIKHIQTHIKYTYIKQAHAYTKTKQNCPKTPAGMGAGEG
jgi:hypothetical protein